MYIVREVSKTDRQKILLLYRKVAREAGGIACSAEEISEQYIEEIMQQASATGIELVVDHPDEPDEIIAEIHGYKLRPKSFAHVISELTIAVDPEFHGQGIGKLIFSRFLELITSTRPDVLRVELFTQEKNTKALNLYKKIGFVIEGRMESRINLRSKTLDADIPMAWFNKNYIGHFS